MSSLLDSLDDYLATRRALGFKLRHDGFELPDFVAFLTKAGYRHVTSAAALAWASQPSTAGPARWRSRLTVARGFIKYLQTIDGRHELPALELLPYRRTRSVPYVYKADEVSSLLSATNVLSGPLRIVTYRTFIGLLAATGLRTGEAIALDKADVDLSGGILTIRKSKFGKTRQVPVHPTTRQALDEYARLRNRMVPAGRTPAFFASTVGRRLIYQNVHQTFLRLVYVAGIADRRPRRPRIHDLRHTFAVRTVERWHLAGLDVERQLPVLSTYLGHISVATTYWYLSAVPELLAAASLRLERALKTVGP